MFYYVYILRSKKDGKIYAGYTKDLIKRLELHNKGEITATKYRRPLELVYYEGYRNQQDATTREKYFKTGWGRMHLKKVLSGYLENL